MALVKIEPYGVDNIANFTFGGLTITSNAVFGNASLGNLATANFVTVSSNLISGNANLGNAASANYFIGNGSLLTGIITTSLVNGTSNVIVTNNGNATISVGGTSNVVIITTTGANVNGYVSATRFVGEAGNLSNIQGANVSGTVAAATTASTVTTNAQPNITSLGLLANLSVNGNSSFIGNANIVGNLNLSGGNANLGNAATANYFVGNGSLLTGIARASIADSVANGNSNVNIPVANGNVTFGVSGNSNVVVVTGTGLNVAGYVSAVDVTASGNITGGSGSGGSITGANLISANYFSGSGNLLSNLQVGNITGLGNIATINKDGNASNILYGNGVFAAAPSGSGTYNNTNVTTLLASYGSNSISTTGNITAGNILSDHLLYANGSPYAFTTNAAGSNTQIQFNNANAFAGSANLTFNNTTNTLSVTNLVTTGANLGAVGNLKITGGSNNQILQTDGAGNVNWVTPNGTSITVDNFTANGVQTAFTLSVTPTSKAYTMVSLAGTLQPRSVYSVAGNVITFSSAPPNTAPIEVTTFSSLLGYGTGDITANTITANTLTGNVIASNSNLTVNTLTANSVINGGSGTPTLQSNTSIVLSAATVVRVSTSPMQFYTCTTTVRDTIAASNGYVIYNTTTNKLQVYANGAWADLN
jgi:hypothetical protein